MKKLACVILLILPLIGEAKIWTVDNTPGSGADSSSLQGLIEVKASNGDTVILMPSHIGYGSLSLYKRIFLYSRGHSNNNIDRDRTALVSSIYFGNYGSASAAGSTIKGLRISSGLNINVNSIHVQNCYIGGSSYIYQSNALIEGCIFESIYYETPIYFNTSSNNNIIAHNYIIKKMTSSSVSGPQYSFVYLGNSSNLIINNILVELNNGGTITNGGFTFFQDSYAKIYNNILWSNVTGRTRFDTLNAGSVFKNNLTYSANSKPTNLSGTGNINDTMPQFEGGYNNSFLPLYRTSNDMRLKSTSPGVDAGTDSTDLGLYGGSYNFSITGNVPGVAVFDDFEVLNPIIKKGDVLKVRINARKPD